MASEVDLLLVPGPKKKEEDDGSTPLTLPDAPLTLTETVNMANLRWIMKRRNRGKLIPEEVTRLMRYADEMVLERGTLTVSYHKKDYGKGRVYPKDAMSMQGISRDVRGFLGQGQYHDLDMANCHPVILISLCQREEWKHDVVQEYVKNRERVLQDIRALDPSGQVTRSGAKRLMLRLMFGGLFKGWLKEEELDENIKPTVFLIRYQKALERIAKKVQDRFPHYPALKRKNPIFSRLSLLLQDNEHTLLMLMTQYFIHMGYQPGVYMYDGVMVHRKIAGSVDPIPEDVLRGCEHYLKMKTGWNINIEEKPLETKFSMTA